MFSVSAVTVTLQHGERLCYSRRRRTLFCQRKQRWSFFWLSGDTRWWGKWGDDGKCFQRRACPYQLQVKNQARAVFFEKSGFGAKIPRTSSTTTTNKKRLYHSPDSKMLNIGPLTFYSYGNLFPLNIKQVYSPAPVTIDSTLLFTCVKKKQMASTYLM